MGASCRKWGFQGPWPRGWGTEPECSEREWVCFRSSRRNTRAKHYSEEAGMLPWNAPNHPPPKDYSNSCTTPPCRSQAPGSPEPAGSPPTPLALSPGEVQLPELTAPPPPPSPAQAETLACGSGLATARPPQLLSPSLSPPQNPSSKTWNSSNSRSSLPPRSPP